MRIAPRQRITQRKITRPDMSIPSKPLNMRTKRLPGRKKRNENPRNPLGELEVRGHNFGIRRPKKRGNSNRGQLTTFASGRNLGGTLSEFRTKQSIYKQGTPAFTLFYIQEGGVKLTARSKDHSPAVTAILGVGDFFGELCLAGYPLRMSTAVSLTASSIRTIKKTSMLSMLRKHNKTSNALVAYLLSSLERYQRHVEHLLTSSAEQRLARVLLRLAHLDRRVPPVVEIPVMSHQVLAEMVGTTRPRVNFFMNRFRKLGYIDYDGGLEVRQSLKKAL